MNIDNLIEQLINLKSAGAETVEVLDTTWNNYGLDHVSTDGTGRRVLIFINMEDDSVEDEEDVKTYKEGFWAQSSNLPWPPVKD